MSVSYKCPQCGNTIITEFEVGNIRCPYCGKEFLASESQQPPVFHGEGAAQQPGYGPQQQPGYGPQQQPGYGPQQQPGYGPQQQPGYGPQQQPGYGPQQPQYGYQQPAPASNDIFANGPSGKSRGLAGLLAIFLGSLGVHYFYLGKTTPGIVFLLVSLFGGGLTCGAAAGVVAIVSLIQGIMMMTMSQQEFESKYINTDNSFPLF